MNPLDQLAPLIAPLPISWWPPAPIWWVLPPLLVLLSLLARWLWERRPQPRVQPISASDDPLRLAALAELAALPRPYHNAQAGPWLQQINVLLKRLCQSQRPQDAAHLLIGRAWLAYLDARCPAAGLTRWMVLVDAPYKRDCRLSDQAIDELSQSVERWIAKYV